MPIQRRITVQTGTGFNPRDVQTQFNAATGIGDAVFWYNEDESTPHWPYPTSGPNANQQTAWLDQEIPGKSESTQLNLDVIGNYTYQCWNHHEEQGTILVANQCAIGPTGTGSSAFAPSPLAIGTGQTVSWQNADSNAHQPAPDSGPDNAWFASPIQPGQISAAVAVTAGGYHCVLHPTEKGTITIS